MRTIGVVLVHYHTPALLAEAVAALRTDAALSGLALAIVVVDNGSTADEKNALEAWRQGEDAAARPVRIFDSGANLGYAGGINSGARLLPECEALLLMNPDVLVLPGCLAKLLAAIDDGAAAAGPVFFWDKQGGFELPPTEAVGFGQDLLRVAAGRWGGSISSAARRRWRRHARRYFLARAPLRAYDLSGAMMLVSAEEFRRIGGFDEGFALYFEETDFLQRLRRAGLSAVFEPRAGAIHLYAQSTPRDGRSGELYAASQQRFREVTYGRLGAALLRALSQGARPPAQPIATPLEPGGSWKIASAARWLEISPSPQLFPAAARRLPADLAILEPVLPPELVTRMAPGTYWLRTLDEDGGELDLGEVVLPDQTRSPSPSV